MTIWQPPHFVDYERKARNLVVQRLMAELITKFSLVPSIFFDPKEDDSSKALMMSKRTNWVDNVPDLIAYILYRMIVLYT